MSVACGIAALDTCMFSLEKLIINLRIELSFFVNLKIIKLALLQFLLPSCWVYYISKLTLQIFIQIKRNIQHDGYQAIV